MTALGRQSPTASLAGSHSHAIAPAADRAAPVGVVVKGYPRLSETFIAQELHGLEARGFALRIYSLRLPYDPTGHPIHDEIAAPVAYLPEYLWRAPLRVWRGWRHARRLAGYRLARAKFLRDLRRDPTPNRVRRFGQACVLAREIDPQVRLLYAHFLHTPASVARYAATMLGLPFAVSAHAKDIWTTPDWEKREKLADAAWLTTCTGAGAAHLRALAGDAAKGRVHLTYHGLDLARFPPDPDAPSARTADDPQAPLHIVSVGRLVAKKGYADLLAALALLPPDLAWRLTHIGGGPEGKRLAADAARLGIAERIAWRGRQPQTVVLETLRQADLFVLASKIADDGDRDGLPNVLMEAQSQSVPCLATAVSAIPELIEDGVSGRLVAPGDPAALAVAIAELARDPAARRRLANNALARLRTDFRTERANDAIAALLASVTADRGAARH